ncbi:4'-phosphopantetheinyl transferase EntD [Catenulispora sp. GAS73]|uniref:4'-phosphopantetheinyl transferase superfamily protein n=1 Tax=Catenulispora sp. GAS73 TaxID=3156269 RepID=UPI003513ED3B
MARIAGFALSRPETFWDRLLFSAKESVYKAWFTLIRTFLDFAGALVTGAVTDGVILTPIVLTPTATPTTGPPGSSR